MYSNSSKPVSISSSSASISSDSEAEAYEAPRLETAAMGGNNMAGNQPVFE